MFSPKAPTPPPTPPKLDPVNAAIDAIRNGTALQIATEERTYQLIVDSHAEAMKAAAEIYQLYQPIHVETQIRPLFFSAFLARLLQIKQRQSYDLWMAPGRHDYPANYQSLDDLEIAYYSRKTQFESTCTVEIAEAQGAIKALTDCEHQLCLDCQFHYKRDEQLNIPVNTVGTGSLEFLHEMAFFKFVHDAFEICVNQIKTLVLKPLPNTFEAMYAEETSKIQAADQAASEASPTDPSTNGTAPQHDGVPPYPTESVYQTQFDGAKVGI